MRDLEYTDICEEKIELLFNGCGTKKFKLNVPEFVFHESCLKHDFYYWRGGKEKDRVKADKEFYKDMKMDLKFSPWYKRPFYRIVAWVYYIAVRLAGRLSFKYGAKKTREDLDKLGCSII